MAANRSRERFAIDPGFSVQERSEPEIAALISRADRVVAF
jgi:hypothetical protein